MTDRGEAMTMAASGVDPTEEFGEDSAHGYPSAHYFQQATYCAFFSILGDLFTGPHWLRDCVASIT